MRHASDFLIQMQFIKHKLNEPSRISHKCYTLCSLVHYNLNPKRLWIIRAFEYENKLHKLCHMSNQAYQRKEIGIHIHYDLI